MPVILTSEILHETGIHIIGVSLTTKKTEKPSQEIRQKINATLDFINKISRFIF